MKSKSALIIGYWKTKSVSINGTITSPNRFYQDLLRDEEEPGDNQDIINECEGVRNFEWGKKSKGTYALALACCFYLKVKWVMDRFFDRELEQVPQGDMRLEYDDKALYAGYLQSEAGFAKELTGFMEELGAIPLNENGPEKLSN